MAGRVIAFFVGGVIALAIVAGFVIWNEGRSVVESKAAAVSVALPSLPEAPKLPDSPTLPPVEPPTLPTPGPQPVS